MVKVPPVVNSNSAWVSTFSLAAVPRRSSQTFAVIWIHHEGRPALHTTHRIACPLTIQDLLMFSGSQSVRHSRPWVEEYINSVALRLRCLEGVTWPLSQCRPPRGALKGNSRAGSGWVLALQQMAGTATVPLILVHREYRLASPGSRKVVTRVSCKASFPPTYLSRATTSEQCSAVHQSAWSTAVCLEAPQETYRPRPPVPVCHRHRRPQPCGLERAIRATFLRSAVICMEAQVCAQVSPTHQPHTAALSQDAPPPPPDHPPLLASTLATSPEILSPPSLDLATGLDQVL